jgi:hypothetical protein
MKNIKQEVRGNSFIKCDKKVEKLFSTKFCRKVRRETHNHMVTAARDYYFYIYFKIGEELGNEKH